LRLLDSEVQKLALFAGEREVTQSDVDEIVGNAREASIFEAVDAALEKRPGVAMRLMYDLIEGGTTVGSIISMLARQVRLTMMAGTLRAKGIDQADIGKRAGINNRYALEKTLRQASRFGPAYLTSVHRKLLEADLAIKTGEQDERLALELLVGRLATA